MAVTADPQFGTFEAQIGQIGASVSVTLHFNDQIDADAYYDNLVSQSLDKGLVTVVLTTKNIRQGARNA